jgi:hypothetical protein
MHFLSPADRSFRTAVGFLGFSSLVLANDIQWRSFNMPPTAMGGSVLSVTIVVANSGEETWGAAHNLVMKDSGGTPVAMESLDGVEPGQERTVNLSYGLPDVTAPFSFQFQALEHEVEYFGPTYWGSVNVTQRPQYTGMQLSSTTFDAFNPAQISTADTWVTYYPAYRLRAKVINNTAWGWHAANLWNTNGAPLDNPPPVGNYAACYLYWVLYQTLYGSVMQVGPERRVAISVTGSVTLSSNWFHASTPPAISTNEDMGGVPYRLFATFRNGQGGTWETSAGLNNNHTRLTNLPPSGAYQVELVWRKYDGAGAVTATGPSRTVTVQVTDGPILVLGTGGYIYGNESYNEEDGTTSVQYDVWQYPVQVPLAGVLRVRASASDGGEVYLNAYAGDGQHLQSGIPELAFAATPGSYSVTVTADRSVYFNLVGELFPYATAPALTSPATAAGSVGVPFSGYTATASGSVPITYGAPNPGLPNGLPPGLTINATTGVVSGTPTAAGSYQVWLTAANGAGSAGRWVTFAIGLRIPTAFAAEQITSSSFLASWSPVSGATGYRLDVATGPNFASLLPGFSDLPVTYVAGGQTLPATSCVVRGLQANTPYWYRVRAVTTAGLSANSAAVSVTTLGHASTSPPPSLWFDVPVGVRASDRSWLRVYDGVPDEVIPSGGARGLTYYVLDWRYSGGSVTFWDDNYPVNDWWHYRPGRFDVNGDGSVDLSSEDFTTWWLPGTTFAYLGDTWYRLGVEFNPEPGQIYDIYYSRNDVVNAASLQLVNGGAGIYGESSARLIFALFNEFTGQELDHGSLYLVRRTFAPAGVQVTLPVIGDVVLRRGVNGASGAITILGDVTLEASATTVSISRPNVGTITVSNGNVSGSLNLGGGHLVSASAAGITLTTPAGVTVSAGAAGTTLTIPGGVSVTVGPTGAVAMTLPMGVGATLRNVADQLGILLGLGVPGGPGAVAQIVGPGGSPAPGGWDAANQIILGNRPAGDYDVLVKESNAQDVLAIRIRLTVPPPPQPRLAVDANRDGTIAFDASDATSSTAPYRFWINDDDDQMVGSTTKDIVPVSWEDWKNKQPDSGRDMEDFARMWINTAGLTASLKPKADGSADRYLGLKWIDTGTTTPGIRVFRHEEADGGTRYLSDQGVAGSQSYATCILDESIPRDSPANEGVVTGSAVYVLEPWVFSVLSDNQPVSHLLFEGCTAGKGQLKLVVLRKQDGNFTAVGEGPGVWLDIMNIKSMYERAVATTGGPRSGNGVDYTIPVPSDYTGPDPNNIPHPTMGWEPNEMGFPYQPNPQETQTYIIYVHGWRWSPQEAINRTETVFKRLWHAGYRGRLAALRWPTFYGGPDDGDSSAFPPYPGLFTFNNSEYRAWKSGESLKQFVNQLPSSYSRNVVAHSMGNVVAGEALRNGMSILNYVMLNAAVPALCYDDNPNLRQWTYTTPNTDTDPGTRGMAYAGRFSTLNTNVINFYLINDSATLNLWNLNNTYWKPQWYQPENNGYEYRPTWAPGNRLSITFAFSTTRFLVDAHEAMAYACQSLTYTVGAEHRTNGSIDDKVNMDALFQFGTEHGAEWDRSIQEAGIRDFYRRLLEELRIAVP